MNIALLATREVVTLLPPVGSTAKPWPFRIVAALCLLVSTFVCAAVHAAEVGELRLLGLDPPMTESIRDALTLADVQGSDLSDRRLAYLVRELDDETRAALEQYGYYSPTITVERTGGDGGPVGVTITVDPGVPVIVRNANVAIGGEGSSDRYLADDLAAFVPQVGDVFDHRLYEGSKTRISRRLAVRGYFDAEFASRRVEITRAEHSADIDLVWTSGPRYDIGPVTFEQTPQQIIRPSLLERLVDWDAGSYYHQGKLDRLREALARLDYFASIDIQPVPAASTDNDIPVVVDLIPAKRSIYTAGLSYGTDSGFGVRLGMQRRYLNSRGHKALGQVDYAERRKTLTLQYRIPALRWPRGWYTISAQAADEQSDYVDSRRVEAVGSRSGEINETLTLNASIHALRERWSYLADDDGDPATPIPYRYATFTYPSLLAEYVEADNLVFPRDALSGSLLLRGGVEGAGSEANFAQLRLTSHWYRGIGESNRLIVRGEIGHTFTNALVDMPPSLRFFAGGHDSIRGYAWREVGPRVAGVDGQLFGVGAENVVTGSVEVEHYFNASWGAAVFVDSGTAFNTNPDWRSGVGVGVRWRSPVGPVQLDIARGLDDPDSSFQLYLGLGADL